MSSEFRVRSSELNIRHGDAFVRECGAADLFQIFQARNEPFIHFIIIRYVIECAKFSCLGPLAVVHMEEGKVISFICDSGCNTTVHSAAYQNNRTLSHAGMLTEGLVHVKNHARPGYRCGQRPSCDILSQ